MYKGNSVNYYTSIQQNEAYKKHISSHNSSSSEPCTSRILGRRFALTSTAYKYLDIGINVGPQTARNRTESVDILYQQIGSRNRADPAVVCRQIGDRKRAGPAQHNLMAGSAASLLTQNVNRFCQQNIPFDEETTEHQLTLAILTKRKLEFKSLPGFDPNLDNLQYYYAQKEIDCDEVYSGIYIGDGITAKNKKYLEKLGITHLLNAAEGKGFGFVNTDKNYYADTKIKYLGLPIKDLPTEDISEYFYIAANFIADAVSIKGKAFIHCMQGISRSATCVLAYLMIKKNMLAIDAIHLVRTNRDVRPNKGFLWHLAQLDNQLRKQRLQFNNAI
ncbi:MAP kinase phosphatase with leucine-rich repeats protein 2 [Pogonomyrmex barbatus]|uniref:protein-serine/threonine phosphatase n=1 Tax=Pogonomyrmex barbatus TaxID=144034 RepID=A0A8N1S3Q5_9HYME|nr:MAP kinase phosphatase with leucine-rich repeats protein 2 [Pogonomyrmex barbatus]